MERLVQNFDHYGPSARREIILAAAEAGLGSWLRGFKGMYAALDPWSARAVLFAAKTLPIDERRYWLKLLNKDVSLLERVLIKSIR